MRKKNALVDGDFRRTSRAAAENLRSGAVTMKTITTRIIAAVLLSLTAFVFAGCNTIHGVGEDMEDAGEAIQRESN